MSPKRPTSRPHQRVIQWTGLAYDCYRLHSQCHRCPIPKLGLSTPCHVAEHLPMILEKCGKPHAVQVQGRTVLVGEKELGTAMSDVPVFKKPQYQAVIDLVRSQPRITMLEVQKRLGIPKYAAHDALDAGFRMGVIRKQTLQVGSIRYKQWFFIGNVAGL